MAMTRINEEHLADAYNNARKFLIAQMPLPGEKSESILDQYLALPDKSQTSSSLNVLYQCLLKSAQNANMKAGVIGGAIGGVDKLSAVLHGFDPQKVIDQYGTDSESVLNAIQEQLKPTGMIRKTPKSIWPKYCQTILSAAQFFKQFFTGDEFYVWANHFYQDKRSIAALPMILAEEIYGIGYPLACDFLKELGFINYGKPDVHIIDIFTGIGLCSMKASPYEIQKIIVKIAEQKKVSPYNVDKLFWLIGSGRFYNHPEVGKQGSIGSRKESFIKHYSKSK